MTKHLTAKPAGTPTWVDVVGPSDVDVRNFYGTLFGWTFDVVGPEFGGYATGRLGGHAVAGVVGSGPGMPAQPPAWTLYFASQDTAADVARAVSLGAAIVSGAMTVGAFGTMAILTDPTGAPFGLWHAGTHVGFEVTDEPGAPTWHELYSPDAKKARAFYMALLGATADPMPGGLEYYVLRHGERMLGGIMQIDPAWGPMPAQWVTYFSVANADETAAAARKLGGRQMGSVDDSPFGRIAALTDRWGATFKALQPPARPPA